VPRGVLVRIALRSFLVQAAWNFERMQHLGFCFALLPLARWLYPDPGSPERVHMVRRHLEFFNTHPFLAAVILGIVARLEADGHGNAAQTCKMSLMGSYGAIGDSFFWGALRPVSAIAGLAVAVVWVLAGLPGEGTGAALAAPLVALLLFNVPHLVVRVGGVVVGARQGIAVVERIARLGLPERTGDLRRAGAALLGVVAVPLLFGPALVAGHWAMPAAGAAGAAAVLVGVLGALGLFLRGVLPTRLAWLLGVTAIGVAIVTRG
jgi:PTS system mannose-specific IID component